MGDAARHRPCDSCFTRRIHERNRDGGEGAEVCCPFVRCPNAGCRFEPHACQVEDHAQLVCLFQRVPCVNACNGCAFELRRGDMHLHLKSCPASVIRCTAEWNRWPVSAPGDAAAGEVGGGEDDDLCPAGIPTDPTDDRVILRSSTAAAVAAAAAAAAAAMATNDDGVDPSDAPSPDYLDVALMNRDQRMLNASRKIPLKLKSALRNNINRKHPAAPVEVPLIWGANDNAVSAQSSSTTFSSDDDPNAPWNQARRPPGLAGSLVEGALFSRTDDQRNRCDNLINGYDDNDVSNRVDNDDAAASLPPVPFISLGRLLHFLLSLSADLSDVDSLFNVETENLAEILLNVEKNAARVADIADGVLGDLVVYPKKIAEQLVDVASDLEEWAEDLDERVAPNLTTVAKKLMLLRRAGVLDDNGGALLTDAANDGVSVLDAVAVGISHSAAYRGLTETRRKMRAMAVELRKADKITAGTRPRRIARNLRAYVVNPLRVVSGEYEDNGNPVDVDEGAVDWSFVDGWTDEYEAKTDVVVDSLPTVEEEGFVDGPSLDGRASKEIATKSSSSRGPSFGLAGLKQLAASFARGGGGEKAVKKESAVEEKRFPPTPTIAIDREEADTVTSTAASISSVTTSASSTIPTSATISTSAAISTTSSSSSASLSPGRRKHRQAVVRLNKEMLPRSQPKPKNMFTFLCAQDFRRDEFENHTRVAHDVVDSGLGGWIERRCPLARLGCPFIVRPLAPSTDSGQIVFDNHLDAFGVRHQVEQRLSHQQMAQQRLVSLQALPPEVLEVIFRYLDGFSLNHVSRTCKFFRDVCFGLLEEKGLVLPVWKRISKGSEGMAAAWRVSHHRWFFSNNAAAHKWVLTDDSFKMNDHLSRCPFNDRKKTEERVLVMFKDVKARTNLRSSR